MSIDIWFVVARSSAEPHADSDSHNRVGPKPGRWPDRPDFGMVFAEVFEVRGEGLLKMFFRTAKIAGRLKPRPDPVLESRDPGILRIQHIRRQAESGIQMNAVGEIGPEAIGKLDLLGELCTARDKSLSGVREVGLTTGPPSKLPRQPMHPPPTLGIHLEQVQALELAAVLTGEADGVGKLGRHRLGLEAGRQAPGVADRLGRAIPERLESL